MKPDKESIRNLICLVVALMLLLWCNLALAATRVTWFGAAQEVSGSMALVEHNGFQLLVDCGQGSRNGEGEETGGRAKNDFASGFPFDAERIAAVLLTHAHMDHCGRLPELFRCGFRGSVYCTRPTRELSGVILEMSVRYDEGATRTWYWTRNALRNSGRRYTAHWHKDCRWGLRISNANLQRFSGTLERLDKHNAPLHATPCPLCARIEARALAHRFHTVAMEQPLELSPGISVRFLPAGHIPGATSILLQLQQTDRDRTLLFSGDLGNDLSPLLPAPSPAPRADLVFVESTYGAKVQPPDIRDQFHRFRQEVARTLANGGIAWIPAFALDRTQKVLYEIERLHRSGDLPPGATLRVPSPTANRITDLYCENGDWLLPGAAGALARISPLVDRDAVDTRRFVPRPGTLLVTTGGMIDSATSLGLLPLLFTRDDVTLFFVGYQSPETWGGRIMRGASSIRIGNRTLRKGVTIRAYDCFSGHADARDIDHWLENNRSSAIRLVHGDAEAIEARKRDLIHKGYPDTRGVEPGISEVLP